MERERERGDVERTIDSQVFFLHDCWLNFYVCTTYLTTCFHPSHVRECRLHTGFLSFVHLLVTVET